MQSNSAGSPEDPACAMRPRGRSKTRPHARGAAVSRGIRVNSDGTWRARPWHIGTNGDARRRRFRDGQGVRGGHDPDIPPQGDENRGQAPPRYAVVLHNDDVNGFGFVVENLRRVFGYGAVKAFWLTFRAHCTGRSVVWAGVFEVAEFKAERLSSCGPDPDRAAAGASAGGYARAAGRIYPRSHELIPPPSILHRSISPEGLSMSPRTFLLASSFAPRPVPHVRRRAAQGRARGRRPLVRRARRAHGRTQPARRGGQDPRRGRPDRAPRQGGILEHIRIPQPRGPAADDRGHDLRDRLDDQAGHLRRRDDAGRAGEARARRPGGEVPPRAEGPARPRRRRRTTRRRTSPRCPRSGRSRSATCSRTPRGSPTAVCTRPTPGCGSCYAPRRESMARS